MKTSGIFLICRIRKVKMRYSKGSIMRTEKKFHVLFTGLSILMLVSNTGCGPRTSTKRYSTWRVIELRDDLCSNYDRAWQTTVEAVAQNWPIEILHKDIGYIRTEWISRNTTTPTDLGTRSVRLIIKFPPGEQKNRIEARTETQRYKTWMPYAIFDRHVYFALASQLGRIAVYHDIGQYDNVISEFTNDIEINPRDATAYNYRGFAYTKKGKYDKAISDYTKVLEIAPGLAEVYYNRAVIYYKKGQHDQAISEFTNAIEINPQYADAHYGRAVAYYSKGQHNQAISNYAKAIEINPGLHKPDSWLIRLVRNKLTNVREQHE
jgi:tetratricopeptide (TPR) repeat protein